MLRILLVAVTSIVLVGCVSAINSRNSAAHAQAGYAALGRSDWPTARRQFAQAVVNADLGGLSLDDKLRVNYEYGRALGVTCFFEQAEKYLLRSKQFAEQSGASPHLSLLELGLVNEKQGKMSEASEYYAQLMPIVEREGVRNRFPLGVAEAYERYGETLKATGRAEAAAAALKEAAAIRIANPNAKPFGKSTPYGTLCEKAA